MSATDLSAEEVARLLDLAPHPEGGFYKETFRDPRRLDGRSVGTAIYYLLPAGQVSAWHRVDAGEIWHWHAGAPLELSLHDGARSTAMRLGSDLVAGERPQGIVPAGVWQSAKSLGAWTLVGCTVSPGFEFAHFELAPPGFPPPA
ncbi:cupin domain-containing protein [Methylocystis sp. JAN1]|uniref:cupin domain-containing protein n=1 Tax=Methylocystis sp. JAN1 TaxID=3397211 RepID=UPI003FA1D9FD